MDAQELKNDLRLVIDQNQQPIKFEIKYCNPATPHEIFDKKKDFGLRLLQILDDPETDSVDLYIVRQSGMIGRMANMQTVCNWHQFSTTMERARKPVILKNIEEMTFLVTTKADIIARDERYKKMSKDQYFHKHE